MQCTHNPHSQKKISQAPQPEDRKRANYFRVLILNISQEAMKNGHKPSHIYNELPILLFQLMLHWALVNKYCHQDEFTKHLERLLIRLWIFLAIEKSLLTFLCLSRTKWNRKCSFPPISLISFLHTFISTSLNEILHISYALLIY